VGNELRPPGLLQCKQYGAPGLEKRGVAVLTKEGLLKRLGIARHAIGKDLIFFFLPFFTVFYIQLWLCQSHGDAGLSGIWGVLWGLVKQPQTLSMLPLQRIVGLALFVIGLTIMIVGQVTLWKNYSGFLLLHKEHQLVTRGLYRCTRHPIYLGLIMVLIGLPVYAASLYGVLAVPVLTLILLNRIRLEEKLLAEEFQDAYQQYRGTTKKLIPFVY